MSQHDKKRSILAVVAHPDDEIYITGTLKNHRDHGDSVHLVWMTNGQMTSMIEGTPEEVEEIRINDAKKAAKIIGAEPRFLNYVDTELSYQSREATLKMVQIIRETRPAIVISNNTFSSHPDHRNTGYIVWDAIFLAKLPKILPDIPPFRKETSIYLLEANTPRFYVDVSDQVKAIYKVIKVYENMYAYKDPHLEHFKMLRRRGVHVGYRYAERFEIRKIGPPSKRKPSHRRFYTPIFRRLARKDPALHSKGKLLA
ncbi:MAG: PIG-L deacetylase family protein [Candidatus Hodarchaeota archaeon]